MNNNIIKWFELLIKQIEFYIDIKKGQDKLNYTFKLKAITNALNIIKSIKHKIKNGDELKQYKGIGDKIAGRVDEIINTGQLSEVRKSDISGEHLAYVDELMKIFGIGRVKAYELYTKYNIKSIDELKIAVKEKNIELPENIIKGIKYVNKIKTNIPRDIIDIIYSKLIYAGIECDPNMDVRVCGSYRREQLTSNDIDVIIAHPDIKTQEQSKKSNLMLKFIKILENKKIIIDSLTADDVKTKYMGICKLKNLYRIDIRFIPWESYYTALLYFTGSMEFNRKMRGIALSMDYTLNEYRLLNNKGKIIKVNSEQDVFDALHMEYMKPNER